MGLDLSGNQATHPGMAPSWRPARTVAVVLAGGTGSRVGVGIPKQLLKIAGKSIIEHTIAILEAAPEIDEIVVLMAPGYVDHVRQIVDKAGFRRVSAIVEGGTTRSETTRIALDLIGPEECDILFHDAVRPLLSGRIVRECVKALQSYAAVDVAIPSADTIVVVDDDDCITDIPVRSRLRRGQTPQAFRSTTIREAYRLAAADPDFTATDDCGVVLRYLPEVPIKVVEGAEDNIKVTHPVDVHLADKLFQLAAEIVPGQLTDRGYPGALGGRTILVFGDGSDVAARLSEISGSHGARVFGFDPATTGTHVERAGDVSAALRTAYDATGRIDYVVVAAGVLPEGPLADLDEGTIERALRVNYLGPITVARLALPYLRETRGHLLFYTSSSYTRGRAGHAVHSSSMAAVVNLTQALAEEWIPESVRVNCVNPERAATGVYGDERPGPPLRAETVAHASIDVLISELTGQIVDVRRGPEQPGGSGPDRSGDGPAPADRSRPTVTPTTPGPSPSSNS